MKKCIICEVDLTEDNWGKNSRRNYINKCNICLSKEKLEYSRKWAEKNRPKRLLSSNKSKAKLKAERPIVSMAREAYGDSKKRAQKNGMDFDLTVDFVVGLMTSAKVCPYLQIDLTFVTGTKAKSLASLDRIDSSRGYTQDNVMVISYLANLMKSNATDDELLAFADGVIALLRP